MSNKTERMIDFAVKRALAGDSVLFVTTIGAEAARVAREIARQLGYSGYAVLPFTVGTHGSIRILPASEVANGAARGIQPDYVLVDLDLYREISIMDNGFTEVKCDV